MIRETKPRKAKYAFEITMSKNMLDYGAKLLMMQSVLFGVPESDTTWWQNYTNSAGTYCLTIYINDEELYQQLKARFSMRTEVKLNVD